MIQIIPSVLVQSEQEFLRCLTGLEKSVEQIQLDIADGEFVPNATWGNPEVVKKHAHTMGVELHLMMNDPMKELKRWATVEQINRILIHYESVKDLSAVLPTLHAYGWDLSIVLNPNTPAEVLDPYLSQIKGVMFMGVFPGFQGQEFIADTALRIKQFKERKTNHFVELDGGVNEETLSRIAESGVDAVCPGSAIFGNDKKPADNVHHLEALLRSLTEHKTNDRLYMVQNS